MKQYETIKMTPIKAVYTVLRGKDKCTPEVWKSAEKMLHTMCESCTPRAPIHEPGVCFKCPACEELLKLSHEYCPACGQAIKW